MCCGCWKQTRKQISILVPYRAGRDRSRIRDWEWLQAYLKCHLPEAEVIVGRDRKSRWRPFGRRKPFSKAAAVNNAFKRSHGDVLVILDADAYLHADVMRHCAERLRFQRRRGVKSWFVPYTTLLRLTEEATESLLESDPRDPLLFPNPPLRSDVESTEGSGHGHRFGALALILPREAFIAVHGMDARMRGWGSEDRAFVLALNTLWGLYRKTPNLILHLWHRRFIIGGIATAGKKDYELRIWPGQESPRANERLASRYHQAAGNVEQMSKLVNEKGA